MSNNPPYPTNPSQYPRRRQPHMPQQSELAPILLPPVQLTTRPSNHVKAKAMTAPELKLSLAMRQADGSTREGPWYGVWNLTLDRFSVVERGDVSTTVSIIYPQFPVTAIWDSDDPDELDETWDMEIDPTSSPDPMDLFSASSFSPSEWHGPRGGQQLGHAAAAGSHGAVFTPPRQSKMPFTPPPVTPSSSIPRSSPNTSVFTAEERHALTVASEIRSTRIPDFVRYVYCLKERTLARIDLIVEVKKVTSDLGMKVPKAEDQLRKQAAHVFADDSRVRTIGCIMSFGPRWRYMEMHRSEVDRAINPDSSYDPSSSSVRSSSSRMMSKVPFPSSRSSSTPAVSQTEAHHALKPFGDNPLRLMRLDNPLSMKMLTHVSDRLKELNEDFW